MQLNNDELMCIAQHLIAQHRQDIFNIKCRLGEACEKCPINRKCFNNSKTNALLWSSTYAKICNSAGVKYSFAIGEHPLVPYEKEDIR